MGNHRSYNKRSFRYRNLCTVFADNYFSRIMKRGQHEMPKKQHNHHFVHYRNRFRGSIVEARISDYRGMLDICWMRGCAFVAFCRISVANSLNENRIVSQMKEKSDPVTRYPACESAVPFAINLHKVTFFSKLTKRQKKIRTTLLNHRHFHFPIQLILNPTLHTWDLARPVLMRLKKIQITRTRIVLQEIFFCFKVASTS